MTDRRDRVVRVFIPAPQGTIERDAEPPRPRRPTPGERAREYAQRKRRYFEDLADYHRALAENRGDVFEEDDDDE